MCGGRKPKGTPDPESDSPPFYPLGLLPALQKIPQGGVETLRPRLPARIDPTWTLVADFWS